MSDQQVRGTLSLLTRVDAGLLCWLCKNVHATDRCPYLTYESQFFMAQRNFQHRTATDAGMGRLLRQRAHESDPALYVACLPQSLNKVRSLTSSSTVLKPQAVDSVDVGPCQSKTSHQFELIHRTPEPLKHGNLRHYYTAVIFVSASERQCCSWSRPSQKRRPMPQKRLRGLEET